MVKNSSSAMAWHDGANNSQFHYYLRFCTHLTPNHVTLTCLPFWKRDNYDKCRVGGGGNWCMLRVGVGFSESVCDLRDLPEGNRSNN